MLAPVVAAASLILSTDSWRRSTQYDLSLMRIFCWDGAAAAAAFTTNVREGLEASARGAEMGAATKLFTEGLTVLVQLMFAWAIAVVCMAAIFM